MNEDPIVAEMRRIREQRASRYDYDIHKMFADLIRRGGVADESHPPVKDASKWVGDVATREALTVKEEPPRND